MSDTPSKVSLSKIAKVAGVSVSTASRALRNHPGTAAETCERVQAIARDLGYQMNPLMTSMMKHVRKGVVRPFQGTIAYIHGLPSEEINAHTVIGQFTAGAQRSCEALGLKMELHWLATGKRVLSRLNDVLHNRGIEGVIIQPNQRGNYHLFDETSFSFERYAVISLGSICYQPELHAVLNDQFHSGVLIARELYALGYRRIGSCLTHRVNALTGSRFLAGMDYGVRQCGGDVSFSYCDEDLEKDDVALNERAFEEWFEREKPEVVVTLETPKFSAYGRLQAMGLKAPAEVGYVSLDCFLSDVPDVSGIDQRHAEVGARAVEVLLSELQNNRLGPPESVQCTMIRSRWVPGTTVCEQ